MLRQLPFLRPEVTFLQKRDEAVALIRSGTDVSAPTVVFDGCINDGVVSLAEVQHLFRCTPPGRQGGRSGQRLSHFAFAARPSHWIARVPRQWWRHHGSLAVLGLVRRCAGSLPSRRRSCTRVTWSGTPSCCFAPIASTCSAPSASPFPGWCAATKFSAILVQRRAASLARRLVGPRRCTDRDAASG